MFEEFGRVSLELSNRCNYAKQHALCPAGRSEDVQILPLEVIKGIIKDLKDDGWGNGNTLSFHVYNEPTNDPRLYWLIEYAMKQLPGIRLFLATNGWYLNETLANELMDVGLEQMTITVYGKSEHRRIKSFMVNIPGIKIHVGRLKTTLLYPTVMKNTGRRCWSPICDLVIRSSGNVGLCCLDYNETVVFGNVFDDSLPVIIKRELSKMKSIQADLISKKRSFPVCQRCHRRRREFHIISLKRDVPTRKTRGQRRLEKREKMRKIKS